MRRQIITWGLACLLRAAPYLARLFWPVIGTAVLMGLGVKVYTDAASGVLDRTYALAVLAGIALGSTACVIWAVGSIREYRNTEPPQPHL